MWCKRNGKKNRYSPRVISNFLLTSYESASDTLKRETKAICGDLVQKEDLLAFLRDELFAERNVGAHTYSIDARRYVTILQKLFRDDARWPEFASSLPKIQK
jgi:hypothetical protein